MLTTIEPSWHQLNVDDQMQMGIAVRSMRYCCLVMLYALRQLYAVAGLLKLHRESTYDLPSDATTEDRIASESARRT